MTAGHVDNVYDGRLWAIRATDMHNLNILALALFCSHSIPLAPSRSEHPQLIASALIRMDKVELSTLSTAPIIHHQFYI